MYRYHIYSNTYTYISYSHLYMSILISFSLKLGRNLKCCTDMCWDYLWIHLPVMPGTRVYRLHDLQEHLHERFAFGNESTSYSQIVAQSTYWVKRYFYNIS